MNDKPKTKWRWRLMRWGLIGLATIVTLAAILITEENWRGKRAWENYRRVWEAKGEKFDWQAFVPPSVPDSQNFFMAPVFTNLLSGKIRMSTTRADGTYPDLRRGSGNWAKGTMTDLKGWQTYYRNPTNTGAANEFPMVPNPQTPAADIVLALSKYDSTIAELRQAAQRPDSSIPLDYSRGFDAVSPLIDYFPELKRCGQVLQLRAIAELASGQNAKALDDVQLLMRLNNSIRNSPFVISHLVRIAIMSIALQPIWEGLAKHKWSNEQLTALDAELAKLDFLADFEFAMRGERAFAVAAIENQRRTREVIGSQENDGFVTNKLYLMPAAYFYQNELAIAQLQQRWILPLVDPKAHLVSPGAWRQADSAAQAEMKRHYHSPYKMQALMQFPALGKAVVKFVLIQAEVDLARVACALERYRLAHGEYPASLDVLAPQFIAKLPHDLINGQPLHYRRTQDGQFILYSVGWNETDDGGEVALSKSGAVDREKGDWVWRYPKE